MDQLNYHHLRYFYAIAREGNLTRAAKRLSVSQSSLSIQLKRLEESLACSLFEREHKSLVLTEEGRMVLNYADTIFRTGEEMLATLENRGGRYRNVLRVGAVSTLSKNFQVSFLREALLDEGLEVVVYAASPGELMGQLKAHTLDLVLSNSAATRETEPDLYCKAVSKQTVSLVVSPKHPLAKSFSYPKDLHGTAMVLPGRESGIRSSFDLSMERAGVAPLLAAEANDMAMLRLIAKSTATVTLVPPIVVSDELESGELVELYQIPDLNETFYAITGRRRYPNPYLTKLLEQ